MAGVYYKILQSSPVRLSLLTTVLLSLSVCVLSDRILLISLNDIDHLAQFSGLSRSLVKLGHDITVVANYNDPRVKSLFSDHRVRFLYHRYPSSSKIKDGFDNLFTDEHYEATYVEKHLKPVLTEECMKVVFSDQLLEEIRALRIKLVVVDSTVFCYHLIPYTLGIPYVTFGTDVYPNLLKMHPLLAMEPCAMRDDSESFFNRLYRLVGSIYADITPKLLIDESQFIVQDKSFYSLRKVAANSSLWFIISDLVLDCPLPIVPGVFQINSLTSGAPTRIPPDLKTFLDSTNRDIVILWFSSNLSNLSMTINEKLSSVFRQSSLSFVWYRDQIQVRNNVFIIENTATSALLSLNKTRLLISDCHTAAVSAAIRHAVPLLCMPILSSHRHNAFRVLTKGVGLHLDIRKFRPGDLIKKIRILVKNDQHRRKMVILSRMQNALPSAGEQAAFWMDHVVRYGWEHLWNSTKDQSFYNFLLLDIYIFALATLCLVFYLCKLSLRLIGRTERVTRIRRYFKLFMLNSKVSHDAEHAQNNKLSIQKSHHHSHNGNNRPRVSFAQTPSNNFGRRHSSESSLIRSLANQNHSRGENSHSHSHPHKD